MRAVTVIVHRVVVISDKVPAVHIIDIAVAVIVDSVARDLKRIDPYIISKVKVGVVYTGIYHCNDHIRAAAGVLIIIGKIFPRIRDTERVEISARLVLGVGRYSRYIGAVGLRTRGHDIVIIDALECIERAQILDSLDSVRALAKLKAIPFRACIKRLCRAE